MDEVVSVSRHRMGSFRGLNLGTLMQPSCLGGWEWKCGYRCTGVDAVPGV